MRSLYRLLLPVAVLAACSSDSTEPGDDQLSGTYNAVTVDGQPLPHEFGSGTVLVDYRIEVREDGTYDLEFNRIFPDNSEVQTSDTGTYEYDGETGEITFTGSIPGALRATLSEDENSMTLNPVDVGGSVVVLER